MYQKQRGNNMNFRPELAYFQQRQRDLLREAQRERLARMLRADSRKATRSDYRRLWARALSLFL